MQLGFVSAILPDLSLEAVFSAARDLQYDCVEFMCWPAGKAERRYAGVTHIDVEEFGESDAIRISEMSSEYGVAISGLGYYPNPLSPVKDESERAVTQIKKVISACDLMGISQMNTFVGRDWTQSVDENWSRFRAIWAPLVRYAEDRDVRIGIENCPMLFSDDEWPGGKNLATSPAIWRRMFNDIESSHFGLNYDPSHMIWQHMDYLGPLREFRDKLFHIHAKDVRLDQDRLDDVGILASPLRYHSPKLPGLGEVNWGKFISVLGDVGYRGPVCVEVEDRSYESNLESRTAALRQSCSYLRNFIPAR